LGGKGRLDRAIADYDEAIRGNSEYAGAYNNRGNVWLKKGDLGRAESDFDQAILIDPKFAMPYNNRGVVLLRKGDFDHAIGNFDYAIRLRPEYVKWYRNRGGAWLQKGDLQRAIADCDSAIKLDQNNADAHYLRGIAKFYLGLLPQAISDFGQASKLNPTYGYVPLWLHVARMRSKLKSQLPQAVDKLDMNKWPAPLIRLFLGEISSDDVFTAADDLDAGIKRGRVCEANFFLGELALIEDRRGDAVARFQAAAADCPKSFTEWAAASAELKALGAVSSVTK
jgi:lipoprotein NlpI